LQLNANGTPDPTFGANGVVKTQTNSGEKNAFAMALQDDGKILLAGYAVNNDYRNAPIVLRFSAAGVLDASFGTNGVATVPVTESDNDFSAIAVQSDGKIVAAGHISNGLSWFSLLVARFNSNGNLDADYGTGGVINLNLGNVDDEFYDVQLTANDEAILTGFTVSQSDLKYHLLLMKFDNGGYPSISFGLDGYTIWGDVPYTFGDAMVLQPDGKILVAGSTGNLASGKNDWAMWRFNADGNVGVSVPEPTDLLNFSVAPNPVKRNGTVSLAYELKESGNISIELVNITGSAVMSIAIGNKSAGKYSDQINLPSDINIGVYFLQIKGTQVSYRTSKVIVIK
jgi:uncharacterized delta-60 repeat protein